jgi:hypothetical protein
VAAEVGGELVFQAPWAAGCSLPQQAPWAAGCSLPQQAMDAIRQDMLFVPHKSQIYF